MLSNTIISITLSITDYSVSFNSSSVTFMPHLPGIYMFNLENLNLGGINCLVYHSSCVYLSTISRV